MTEPKVKVFATSEQVAQAVAKRFVELADEAITRSGQFSVALAGGNTPRRAYELLSTQPFKDQVDWKRVYLFFGDERSVASDHQDSNFLMVYESMISKLPIPPGNVHRIIGEGDVEASARAYEEELRLYFQNSPWPHFDLVLLGLGEDCHTASLFPESAALKEPVRWVTPNWVQKLNSWRITLTAPAINNSRHVLFIVTGHNKSGCVEEVLFGSSDPERVPAQLIESQATDLQWFIDRDAALTLHKAQQPKDDDKD